MYQVGGSLANDYPCYVERKADTELYETLQKGDFCYVLNSRQVGKSSLMIRTKYRLQAEGYQCTVIDMTNIGSENITPLQWYKGIVADIVRGLNLFRQFNLKSWWQEVEDLSLLQRLSRFIEYLVLEQFPEQKIVIFIDEIDSILSLKFSVDDFFALIRYCYNQRAINPEYKRVGFAIFGVATPGDLIQDYKRTPFNIGTAINLQGFELAEVRPLILGLESKVNHPQRVMQEILEWTGGQPFLTQKVCKIIEIIALETGKDMIQIPRGTEKIWIESLVRSRIIDNWEFQDEPEHLRTIEDRILHNPNLVGKALSIYQHILQKKLQKSNNSREQIQLLLSGLIIKNEGYLQIKNRIYQEIFNLEWINKQLSSLRPYSQTFEAWKQSGNKDESRLLRGKALKEAQNWSFGKSLSQLDYQYLSASEEYDRQEVQQALEAQRIKEVEARLIQQRKTAKLQKTVIKTITLALCASIGFGILAVWQYYQATINENNARISEIKALISSSQGQFVSQQKLDALIDAIKAQKRLKLIHNLDPKIKENADLVLDKAIYGVVEKNRLIGGEAQTQIVDIIFTYDNRLIITASAKNSINIWTREGQLLRNIINQHNSSLKAIDLSHDNQNLVTGNDDGFLKIWRIDGTLLRAFPTTSQTLMDLCLSPNDQIIAVAFIDGTIQLWHQDGTLITTFKNNDKAISAIKFSPDGKLIATAHYDNMIRLWDLQGNLIRTFAGHTKEVRTINFSDDGNLLVSGSEDKMIRLWSITGAEKRIIGKHDAVQSVTFSPDAQTIVSVSWDGMVKLWNQEGRELADLEGHQYPVWVTKFSRDGKTLATGDFNGQVKLWEINNQLLKRLTGYNRELRSIKFSDDSKTLVSGSWNGVFQIWNIEGQLLLSKQTNQIGIINVDLSKDGQNILTGSWNNTAKIWNTQGEEIATLSGNKDGINAVKYSSDGQLIISAGLDGDVKLWNKNGTLITTFAQKIADISTLDFSPNNQIIVVGRNNQMIEFWNLKGEMLKQIKAHQGAVWGIDWSPDGTFIASGSPDQTVKLWFLDPTKSEITIKKTLTLKGHNTTVDKVAISPDSKIIASASWDQTIKLWDRNGNLIKTLAGHTKPVRNVAFSNDGQWLASGSDDNYLILWDLKKVLTLNELKYACDWARNYLHHSANVEAADRTLCD